jgi:hypothetical protein
MDNLRHFVALDLRRQGQLLHLELGVGHGARLLHHLRFQARQRALPRECGTIFAAGRAPARARGEEPRA